MQLNPDAQRSQNSIKVNHGMNRDEFLTIMGSPGNLSSMEQMRPGSTAI